MTYWIVCIFISIVIGGPQINQMTVHWEMEQLEFYGFPAKTKKECIENAITVMEQTDPMAPRITSVKCVPAQVGDFPKLERIYEIH